MVPVCGCQVHMHKPPLGCLSADPPKPYSRDIFPTGVSVRASHPRPGDSHLAGACLQVKDPFL